MHRDCNITQPFFTYLLLQIYPTHGSSEEWSYALSWDWGRDASASECVTDTYGGFDNKLLIPNTQSNRFPWYLVETGDEKEPDQDTLGTVDGIKAKGFMLNFHV